MCAPAEDQGQGCPPALGWEPWSSVLGLPLLTPAEGAAETSLGMPLQGSPGKSLLSNLNLLTWE